MTLLSILALANAMFLLAITPGPGVFATISKALSTGFKNTIPLIAGIILGDLVFLFFAIYGLATIAETFNALFLLIRYLGSAYLIWLGIQLYRSSPEGIDLSEIQQGSHRSSFLGGFSITVGNPKVILFYLSFLPTFVRLETLSTLDVCIVGMVVSLVLGSVMLFYAFTAAKTRQLFTNRRVQKKLNITAGTAMIGTGAFLLAKS